MKYNWIIHNKEIFENMKNKKVLHVVQNRKTLLGKVDVISWRGELNNDQYFNIMYLEGVVFAEMNEREMLLSGNPPPLTYVKEVNSIVKGLSSGDFNDLYDAFNNIDMNFLSTLNKELTFEDVMGILMWKYASEKVEAYEPIPL
jgi:hypothetical protein